MKTLLASGESVLVDDDFQLPPKTYIRINRRRGGYVEVFNFGGKFVARLHRLICDAPKGMYVDHINHDVLDNRRENLRLCTPAQSAKNVRWRQSDGKYKGTAKKGGRWLARIMADGVRYESGPFDTEVDAALAVNQLLLTHHGEFACLNVING